jgi:hypothetical protein
MNESWKAEVNKSSMLVQALWKPQLSKQTDNSAVDKFLEALRAFRRFEQQNPMPHRLDLSEISELASDARRWFTEFGSSGSGFNGAGHKTSEL